MRVIRLSMVEAMASECESWFRHSKEGLEVFVRLTPSSAADSIDGIAETSDGRRYLKVRVRAAPENGKANRALEKLIAKHLRLPKSSVALSGGATSRLKTVSIDADQVETLGKLAELAGAQRED